MKKRKINTDNIGVSLLWNNKINPNMVDTIISLPIVLLLHFEYKKNIGNIE